MRLARALLMLTILVMPLAAEAASPTIAGASVDPNDRTRVNIILDGGVSEADVVDKAFWFVLFATKTTVTAVDASAVMVTGCANDTSPGVPSVPPAKS